MRPEQEYFYVFRNRSSTVAPEVLVLRISHKSTTALKRWFLLASYSCQASEWVLFLQYYVLKNTTESYLCSLWTQIHLLLLLLFCILSLTLINHHSFLHLIHIISTRNRKKYFQQDNDEEKKKTQYNFTVFTTQWKKCLL